jgi:hypothetical protein
MQLKRPSTLPITSMRCGLAAAAAALVAGHGTSDAQELEVDTDASLLVYTEPDRVSLVEGVVAIEKTLAEDQLLRLQLAFDGLTGASANGAAPATAPQTFTSPSGNGTYTVGARNTPLDSTFHDTRGAGSLTYSRPLDRLTTMTAGVQGSFEYDYQSLGANAGLTRDFDRRNTTVALGVNYSSDTVAPVGDVPIAFAAMVGPRSRQPKSGSSESKTVLDGLVGITQVLGRSTLGRLNFSVSRSTGYLTDPYKVLSLVNPASSPNAGEPVEYLYESRPDARTKSSVYAQLRHALASDVIDVSYRYLWDDWGIRSHTVDGSYRWRWGEHYLQPHLRWYHQTGADFFRPFLVDGDPLPDHATADYRQGPMDAWTWGLTLGLRLPSSNVLRVTLEYYRQATDPSNVAAIGALQDLDLDPDVSALMARVGFSREW